MSYIDKMADLSGWRFVLICIVIGIIGIFGHAPYHVWPVTIFMFAVLFRLVFLAKTPRRAYWTAQLVGFGYFLGQVYWVASAFAARGADFIYIMPVLLGGLAILLGIFWGLAAWVFKKFKSNSRWPYLTIAGLILLAEMGRGHVLSGFPWDLPGYIFEAGGPMSQSASFLGIYGLSLAVLIVAALLVRACFYRHTVSGIVLTALLAANFGYGFLRLQNAELQYADNVKLRLVAVPFSQKDKIQVEGKWREILIDHIDMSAEPGLGEITHLIWPEGALDFDIAREPILRRDMRERLVSAGGQPPIWIVNSSRIAGEGDDRKVFNASSVVSFDENLEGSILSVSDKKKLVPFGEFIPGGDLVKSLGAKIVASGLDGFGFAAAPEKTVTQIPGLTQGSIQICYEIIFSGLTPRPEQGRINWILNQSNDAWFGANVGPHQHANIARYRAIEEKVPVIRAASNGFSGVIDPYGRFINVAAPGELKVIDSVLPRPIGEALSFSIVNLLIALLTICLVIIPHRVANIG